MNKKILILLLLFTLLFTSCAMEATIPENSQTFSIYFDHSQLFSDSVQKLMLFEEDVLISRNDYFRQEGSENIEGLYIQKMADQSFQAYADNTIQNMIDIGGVKLIDVAHKNGITVCCFDLCVPGRNFDYGIYYVSEDKPIFLGDVTYQLGESGNGYSYEQPASYGTKFTYYTEKITDHYYYYEIS